MMWTSSLSDSITQPELTSSSLDSVTNSYLLQTCSGQQCFFGGFQKKRERDVTSSNYFLDPVIGINLMSEKQAVS